ncbi:MAG TPA: hypothetical protein DCW98_05300 [Bacteroidales bacterium]|nr:hypothetical protein [Bacteroidales bacterium]
MYLCRRKPNDSRSELSQTGNSTAIIYISNIFQIVHTGCNTFKKYAPLCRTPINRCTIYCN